MIQSGSGSLGWALEDGWMDTRRSYITRTLNAIGTPSRIILTFSILQLFVFIHAFVCTLAIVVKAYNGWHSYVVAFQMKSGYRTTPSRTPHPPQIFSISSNSSSFFACNLNSTPILPSNSCQYGFRSTCKSYIASSSSSLLLFPAPRSLERTHAGQ